MFFHMCMNTFKILEEFYMTKLIQFIMSDRLYGNVFADIIQVCLRCCQSCDTRTREADLGCRCKFINHVRISGFFAFIQNFKKEILVFFVIIKMMYTVSIIPVNTEIRCCRFQICKTLNGLFGICVSLRVGIFRYTPDTFDRRIFTYQFFYNIHIRSFR